MLRRPLLPSNHEAADEKSWLAKAVHRFSRQPRTPLVLTALFFAFMFVSLVAIIVKDCEYKTNVIGNYVAPLNEMIYSDADAPFFNESVASYRKRLQWQLDRVIPGTIFVSVASFRDTKCQLALRQLFDRAEFPERVYVGLVDQTKLDDFSDDVPCEASLQPSERARVRLVRIPSQRARGPTHARYIASKLWLGEEVFMQVDAHSWFAHHWDTLLLANLNALPDPNHGAVTHYPPGTEGELGQADVTWVCEAKLHEQAPAGLFVQGQDVCRNGNKSPGIAVRENGAKTTCLSPFMGGGFFAAKSNVLYDAPYDRYLPYIFHGEEVLIAARLWTSGWDLFTPIVNIVAHNYSPRVKNVHVETPTWGPIGRQSEARARFLLQSPIENDVDFDRSEIEFLGMGTKRPLKEYLVFAGIDRMANGQFQSRCHQRWQNGEWVDENQPQVDG